MTIEDVEDLVRTYSPAEDRQLAEQLRAITADCHAGALWPIGIETLREIHRRLFAGVRGHAGAFRAKGFADEHLTFGPNRSVHRDHVMPQLDDLFRQLARSLESFASHPDAADYERSAVHVAVWAHAEVVRIHPFLDGNGRSSRLIMNAVLVGLGLRPVAVEAVKQEYNRALNDYFDTKQIGGLIDLVLRLFEGP